MDRKKEELNAKDRFHKINITETAIAKVPFIHYKDIDEPVCEVIWELTKEVLRISKTENDGNEVAITYHMPAKKAIRNHSQNEETADAEYQYALENPEYGIAYGDEHSVSLESDTITNHLLMTTREVTLIVLHNHPAPQTLSYNDLAIFFTYACIKMMLVVTNQGTVHYILKDKGYNFSAASKLMAKYSKMIRENGGSEASYAITKKLLKECRKIGLIYK